MTQGAYAEPAQPVGSQAEPGGGKVTDPSSQPASQTEQADANADPDADPNTPGIAEVHDPGRATMLARQRDAVYEVVPEEQEAEFEDEESVPETEETPEQASTEQAPAPQQQPVQQA